MAVELRGVFEDQDEAFVQAKYGHPKDRRVDLTQMQAGLAATGDGGIPVFSRVNDGGAGEAAQVVGAMSALEAMAGRRDFLLVADSKLASYPNITALAAAEVTFVASAPAAKIPASGAVHVLRPGDPVPIDLDERTEVAQRAPAPGGEGLRTLPD